MDEKVVENSVMNAKTDPKVVMDLSIHQIGGWNNVQSRTFPKLLEEFMDENEPLLNEGIPKRGWKFWTLIWMSREVQTHVVEHISTNIDCNDSEGFS